MASHYLPPYYWSKGFIIFIHYQSKQTYPESATAVPRERHNAPHIWICLIPLWKVDFVLLEELALYIGYTAVHSRTTRRCGSRPQDNLPEHKQLDHGYLWCTPSRWRTAPSRAQHQHPHKTLGRGNIQGCSKTRFTRAGENFWMGQGSSNRVNDAMSISRLMQNSLLCSGIYMLPTIICHQLTGNLEQQQSIKVTLIVTLLVGIIFFIICTVQHGSCATQSLLKIIFFHKVSNFHYHENNITLIFFNQF